MWPQPLQGNKRLLNNGVWTPPKVLEAYMGEAELPAEPTRGRKAQPPRALAQRGGIVAKNASGCYSVFPATY